MMNATYSPEDNKLRLYSVGRLDAETYAKVKAAGFRWAPRQELFVAPAWTPQREDLLIELCGEIGDEDTSLEERAEERSEAFEGYSKSRMRDAEAAQKSVSAIADNIPFGQPILVGHHSERHARRDAEKIQRGMERAVKNWRTSQYWTGRAEGAIRHAKYKERPDVRARRIKKLEAEQRKVEKSKKETDVFLRLWQLDPTVVKKKDGTPTTLHDRAVYVAGLGWGVSRCFTLAEYPRTEHTYEGMITLGEALEREIIDATQAQEIARRVHGKSSERSGRWLEHLNGRLEYERAMLAGDGGTVADRTGPEVGGGCKCWASPRGGWSYIKKVNRVSVTVLDNWGNAGGNFTRTIPFDKLGGVMTKADVEWAREGGRLTESGDGTGFCLAERPAPAEDLVCPDGPTCPDEKCQEERTKQGLPVAEFEAMADTLRNGGVKVVTAPNLFPTPPEVAKRMVEMAEIEVWHTVLEPSAGTGNIWRELSGNRTAVEINTTLADRLRGMVTRQDFVICADFLEWNTGHGKTDEGVTTWVNKDGFDRIVMNPPFDHGSDIKHIEHALTMLKPGGRLVAICARGPKQQEILAPLASHWEALPEGTFAGTGARAALIVIEGGKS